MQYPKFVRITISHNFQGISSLTMRGRGREDAVVESPGTPSPFAGKHSFYPVFIALLRILIVCTLPARSLRTGQSLAKTKQTNTACSYPAKSIYACMYTHSPTLPVYNLWYICTYIVLVHCIVIGFYNMFIPLLM